MILVFCSKLMWYDNDFVICKKLLDISSNTTAVAEFQKWLPKELPRSIYNR